MRMPRQVVRVWTVACLLMPGAHGVALAMPQAPPAGAAPQSATAPGKACLDCHGPADTFMAASTMYQVPGPEKIKVIPHRYVPHNSKLATEIPECTNCHRAHSLSPLPKAGSVDRSALTVEWCFKACHHTRNFKPCKECHE